MYTITQCYELELKTCICIASKLLYFHISSSITIKSCFTLGVCRHICIFSKSVNLLFLFDSVAFCYVSLLFSLPVCLAYVSVTFSVVLLQPVAKWSKHLQKIRSFPRQYTLYFHQVVFPITSHACFALFLDSFPPVLSKCHFLFFSTVLFPYCCYVFVHFSVVLLSFSVPFQPHGIIFPVILFAFLSRYFCCRFCAILCSFFFSFVLTWFFPSCFLIFL